MSDYPISNVPRRIVYTGSAGVGPYAFPFEILEQTDVGVYKNDTLLTLTTDYTVSISPTLGTGSVTLVSAAISTDRITITGTRAVERVTDFTTGGDFFANTLNAELDSIVIMIQQVSETVDRAIKTSITSEVGTALELPNEVDRAGKIFAFDDEGNAIAENYLGEWQGNWASGSTYQKRDLIKDASNGNVYICVSGHTSSGTTPITSNTDAAKWALVIDVAAVTVAKIAAETAATNASNSATAASNSATTAGTSATNAANSATAANNAKTAAESARDATLAAFDSFDDRYLGTKTSDPALDNDGNALVAGALYFNSADGVMKVYTGSVWVAAYVSGTGFLSASANLSDLTNVASARTNLGLVIGTNVQAYNANTVLRNVENTFTDAQRGAITTDNDLSFDLSVGNNFLCTPAATGTLTFTNLVSGQSGYIILKNTGGFAISKNALVLAPSTFLTTISTAGNYLLAYHCDGTNVFITSSGVLA